MTGADVHTFKERWGLTKRTLAEALGVGTTTIERLQRSGELRRVYALAFAGLDAELRAARTSKARKTTIA